MRLGLPASAPTDAALGAGGPLASQPSYSSRCEKQVCSPGIDGRSQTLQRTNCTGAEEVLTSFSAAQSRPLKGAQFATFGAARYALIRRRSESIRYVAFLPCTPNICAIS